MPLCAETGVRIRGFCLCGPALQASDSDGSPCNTRVGAPLPPWPNRTPRPAKDGPGGHVFVLLSSLWGSVFEKLELYTENRLS